ncbi:reverse transcriptase-like protein [Peribacillus cavernae]|uniref:Reverse transcriptase-like protein n=1 Tax=Peribacillus cavernae TaxID=1674310 RepID=A0A433HKJ9_9BACI|nr:ribonuclease H family protein [Peribacillus cavernae]MDQ0218010.1 ribonuclease HI [Peribacillus cavernae]RUQ28944.1 reverse transcriptase-like protein [Peribacillus cavernae]
MKVIMHWTYGSAKKPACDFTSDWLDAGIALIIADDLEKAGRMKTVEFKDEIGTSWTKKELKKLLVEIDEDPSNVTVYFDGGFQKEDGLTGIGVAIYYTQGKNHWRLRANALLAELDSNNEAEYAALFEAVKHLEELGVHHQSCRFKGDSQVVLKQLSGEWSCFEENLNRWLDRIEQKIGKLGIKPIYEPIPRKENSEADKLATQALKGEEILSKLNISEK